MSRHPANNGKVMLTIWVEAPLRDYVRARAMEAKQPVSEWAGRALMKAVAATSLGAFCFPADADRSVSGADAACMEAVGTPGVRDPANRCDMFSPGKPTNGGCRGDGHYLCNECVLHEESP